MRKTKNGVMILFLSVERRSASLRTSLKIGSAYLPLLRIQAEDILSLLLIANTKIVLAIRPCTVQSLEPLPLLLRVLVVFLKREIMYIALHMRKICRAGGDESTLDQGYSKRSYFL